MPGRSGAPLRLFRGEGQTLAEGSMAFLSLSVPIFLLSLSPAMCASNLADKSAGGCEMTGPVGGFEKFSVSSEGHQVSMPLSHLLDFQLHRFDLSGQI